MHVLFVVQWRHATKEAGISVPFDGFGIQAVAIIAVSDAGGVGSKSCVIGTEKTAIASPWKYRREALLGNDVVAERGNVKEGVDVWTVGKLNKDLIEQKFSFVFIFLCGHNVERSAIMYRDVDLEVSGVGEGQASSYIPHRKNRRVCCQRDHLVISMPLQLPVASPIRL